MRHLKFVCGDQLIMDGEAKSELLYVKIVFASYAFILYTDLVLSL